MRGKANRSPLVPELAFSFGRLSVSLLSDNRHPVVVVGRDTRISGPMFEGALLAGLCSSGATVLKLGVAPTPVLSFATAMSEAAFGVVLSASHNTYSDNGIKFFDGNGRKLSPEAEQQLEEAYLAGKDSGLAREIDSSVGRIVRDGFYKKAYTSHVIHSVFGTESRALSDLRVVLDCAHGATYRIAPRVFKQCGAQVTALNVSPNGTNINKNCGSTSLSLLARAVRRTSAHIGLAFDGDGDRCIAVDRGGNTVDGDAIMTMCGLYMKERGTLNNDTVVATVMTNMGVECVLKRAGIRLLRTSVGDRHVASEMRKSGSNLGGEQSGHVIFSDVLPTGDGIVTGLWLSKVLVERKTSIKDLMSVVETFPQIMQNVFTDNPGELVARPEVKEAIQTLENQLGAHGRILVRPSGTEPVVRVMVEGKSEKRVRQMVEKAVGIIERYS